MAISSSSPCGSSVSLNPACVQTLKVKESRMGIAMFTLTGLLAPLHGLAKWLGRAGSAAPQRAQARHAHVRPAVVHASHAHVERPRHPLRVLRVVEGSRQPAGAGRMRISGRMADVCAELERLAALETTAR
jgi:hypothetical protein